MHYLKEKILIAICLLVMHEGFAQRNIITKELQRVGVDNFIRATNDFKPFPYASDRAAWAASVPETLKNTLIREAGAYTDYVWPEIPATLFLEYSRTGIRKTFEAVSFGRRDLLASLVLAECLENKGRFLNSIVNGIWAINEESFWGVPAHINLPLPDINDPYVDLFAAETGSLLSWTYYFLQPQLDSISPVIGQRMAFEINKRILTPVLTHNNYWWMGYESGMVNNWNPWIISNWMTCALIWEKDPAKKKMHFEKSAECLDHFINQYPEDGGCDEGTSYWGKAGGALFDCLKILYDASGKSFDIFNNQLIKNIGAYLVHTHIDKRYFVNFADGAPLVDINADVVYQYGKLTANPALQNLGSFAAKQQRIAEGRLDDNLYHRATTVLIARELLSGDTLTASPLVSWLPDLQVFTARDETSSGKGFFIAAKGGHNAESHNHNDVGSFVVYYDGKPALIDVGVGNYTQKTFSAQRYDIWTMQSAFHNTPTVNGVMQSAGKQFAAKNVQFKNASGLVNFSLDLAGAYPPEANIIQWKRNLEFKRHQYIRLTDDFRLSASPSAIYLTLMTSLPVRKENGKLILSAEAYDFQIVYNDTQLSPEVEEINIDDSRLRESWNDKLYRIKLNLKNPAVKGKVALTMTTIRK